MHAQKHVQAYATSPDRADPTFWVPHPDSPEDKGGFGRPTADSDKKTQSVVTHSLFTYIPTLLYK